MSAPKSEHPPHTERGEHPGDERLDRESDSEQHEREPGGDQEVFGGDERETGEDQGESEPADETETIEHGRCVIAAGIPLPVFGETGR